MHSTLFTDKHFQGTPRLNAYADIRVHFTLKVPHLASTSTSPLVLRQRLAHTGTRMHDTRSVTKVEHFS